MRAVVEVEEINKRTCLVVTELPYQVNPDNLALKIAELVKDGRIKGISDVRDEGNERLGQRLVIVYSACLGRMSGPGTHGGLAPYRISKAGVNAFVKNLSYETGLGARGFLVDAICPNHCRTDMGGPDAPRSAQEGADTAIWLATREFDPAKDKTGLLWEDRQVVDW